MDEYLRNRYKNVGGDSAQPPKPASGRYTPPPAERLQRQPAQPMFPVRPAAPRPVQPPQHHQSAPVQRQPAQPQPAPASANNHALAAHPQPAPKHHARSKRRFPFVKVLITLLILGAGTAGSYYYLAYVKAPSPLPQKLVESIGFPVYYPAKPTGNYIYQTGSANNLNGLLNYKVADGSNGVIINEQTRPGTNFNPSALPKFKQISVSSGTAVIGVSSGVMTIVYDTPTTLINMTALNNISRADMISIAQNMGVIKRKTGLLQVFNIGFISSGVVMERAVYKN